MQSGGRWAVYLGGQVSTYEGDRSPEFTQAGRWEGRPFTEGGEWIGVQGWLHGFVQITPPFFFILLFVLL